jgi:hypothetical protein
MNNTGIVPPGYRRYSEAETTAIRKQISLEVSAEYAAQLESRQGLRLWWLKWRLQQEVEKRVRQYQNQGI